MDKLELAKRLKNMLAQVAPQNRLENLEIMKGRGGLESFSQTGDPHEKIAVALDKLATDRHEQLSPEEMFGLEAIVMKQNRPAVFVRNGTYDTLTDTAWLDLNDEKIRERINPLFPLIGRIELPPPAIPPYLGTGFVVAPGVMMTNRHVARVFADGLGKTIRYTPGDAFINFKREVGEPDDSVNRDLKVVGVEMIHPFWDMALLRVDGLPSGAALPLSILSPEDLVNEDIVVIGYPARDDRNDLTVQDEIFGGKYFVKRLAPGVVRDRATIPSFENKVSALTHNASTLGGNSGSAVVHVRSGKVVALHFAGVYLVANYAVPMFELARDRRLEKLNFDGSVPKTTDWEAAWAATESAPRSIMPPPAPIRVHDAPPPAPLRREKAAGEANWIIPIHVSISVGAPEAERQPEARLTSAGAALGFGAPGETVVVDQDYSDRPGYDPDFLQQVSVPLPRLGASTPDDTAVVSADAQVHGDPHELAYYHYSVYMNKRRRTAWFSAANVDGDRRPDIGRRQGDRWYVDTRIDRSEQLGQQAFEHGIDRGHLTRREDTAWGDDEDDALKANNDTFHFTNCSLQASPFNRGKDRWQGLEQFLLEQHAKKELRRMIVVTGPVFSANDPVYQNDQMDYSVQCPLQFWKVCVLVRQSDGSPSATAFVLGQNDIRDLPGFEAVFDVAATQITIEDLEQRTGLDFGALKQVDHFAQTGAPGALELPSVAGGPKRKARVIRRGADIVV
jgi:endonuclease G